MSIPSHLGFRPLSKPSYAITLAVLISITLYLISTSHSSKTSPNWYSILLPSDPTSDSSGPLDLDWRLEQFRNRPVWEHAELQYPSRYACPLTTFNRDEYFFNRWRLEKWPAIRASQLREWRQELFDYISECKSAGIPLVWSDVLLDGQQHQSQRGILYAGGDGKALKRLRLSLHFLRNVVNSELPVEIYHYPDEFQGPGVKDGLLNDFGPGIRLVEVGGKHEGKNWQVKISAFLSTAFTEFVWLDTDNFPLIDPAELFDTVEYRANGHVFWSDLNKDHPDNAVWRLVGQACSDRHWPAETGQVIYDKRGNNGLNYAVLRIAWHMMEKSKTWGEVIYGDKDTFRFAMYILGLEYQMAPRVFTSAGGYVAPTTGEDIKTFCGHSMMHYEPTPWSQRNNPDYRHRPAFMHTILGKHSSKLQAGKLFSNMSRPLLDGISEPTLIRTPARWSGSCFDFLRQGPSGVDGGFNDGQDVVFWPIEEAFKDEYGRQRQQGLEVIHALQALGEEFMAVHQSS
ncbi:mannosyltransferase putative-domain-containing protein [Naematelia encephala]|uniref:Mannosyltransferase putative-domain-containing protein n=1 Tax=Naematelia encephala TaxID=71784 RepID=A0A1Y2BMB3_9TREE|nr:mannosyltransferase putative-domain-containing protein [Naematelia encephala]